MFYSINSSNLVVEFPLLLDILDNIYIAVTCFLGYKVTHFEINFMILIIRFSTWAKLKTKNETTWERKELLR